MAATAVGVLSQRAPAPAAHAASLRLPLVWWTPTMQQDAAETVARLIVGPYA